MNQQPAPKDIKANTAAGELHIDWGDDEPAIYAYVFLRGECRCAHCVDEMTGRRILDLSTIPPDIKIAGIAPVGNYAIRIDWSDGHNTGLYTWQRLRVLGDAGGK